MSKENELTPEEVVFYNRLQVWTMSLVCILLCFFAATAAARIPHYLATSDYFRLTGVFLFCLLTLLGLVVNIRDHFLLWRP